MLRRWFRERGAEVAIWVIGVVGLGTLRPRWVAAHTRRTWRQHFWRIFRLRLLVGVLQDLLRPISERSERARAELEAELGRTPTIEEQMARMRRLQAEPR